MLTRLQAEERVARGAAHLDQVRPGWFDHIDVGTLTLHDPCGCIVGQLCGRDFEGGYKALALNYEGARLRGFFTNEGGWAEFSGERYDRGIKPDAILREWYQPLQDAWIAAIAARRFPVSQADAEPPSSPCGTESMDQPASAPRAEEASHCVFEGQEP